MKVFVIIIVVLCLIIFVLLCVDYAANDCYKLNSYFTKNCKQQAIFNPQDQKWTQRFRDNYQWIKAEFLDYAVENTIPNYKDLDTEVSLETEGWKSIFLKVFGNKTNASKKFPITMTLINSVECPTAYFSILEPGAKIKPHNGVYKGVLRYHLGLIIPTGDLFIEVDNIRMHWKEGKDLLFDDMFTHCAENNTDQKRVILFMDIKRDFENVWLNLLNTLFLMLDKSNEHVKLLLKNANYANEIN